MNKFKSHLKISTIGNFRFYSGILVGILYSIVFNYLFRLITRFANIGEYYIISAKMNVWRNIVDYEFSEFYLLLISASSVGFGFCYTTYLWTSKTKLKSRKLTSINRKAHYNSLFVLYMPLLFFTRMIMFFVAIDLTIEKDIGYVAFLLPLFTYFYSWSLVSIMYKTKLIMFMYTLLMLIITFLLYLL